MYCQKTEVDMERKKSGRDWKHQTHRCLLPKTTAYVEEFITGQIFSRLGQYNFTDMKPKMHSKSEGRSDHVSPTRKKSIRCAQAIFNNSVRV